MSLMKIECDNEVSNNVRVTDEEGNEVKGITALDIRMRPGEIVTAKMSFFPSSLAIKAEVPPTVWVVGRVQRHNPSQWSCVGVFDDQEKAEKQCLADNDFVAPMPLNQVGPDEAIKWPGAYFPHLEPRPLSPDE